MNAIINILAIESSCDDTSAAVLQNTTVLSNLIANQKVHSEYGGVVPELASREHQKNIVPVVHEALKQANLSLADIHAIAYTRGPGLMGSLLVGTSFAKGLSMGLNIPMIEVNHMHAHILAHFAQTPNQAKKTPEFPFICLTVSGGHTQIVLVKSGTEFTVIGSTIDDAVGEAYDKAAKIMGLPYPGGPQIDRLAALGNPKFTTFPSTAQNEFDFSFSGIKTSLLYYLQKQLKANPNFLNEHINDVCASYQYSIVKALVKQVVKAAKYHNVNQIALAGGVSANSYLRRRIQEVCAQNNREAFIPDFQFCTDNAAMIGVSGYFNFINNSVGSQSAVPFTRYSS